MKTHCPTWFVGALSLSTLISQAVATDGIMVELRIRKPDLAKRGLTERSLLEVREASIIADGGFTSFIAERADNSTLSSIEQMVQKRQSANDNKNGAACKKKTEKCYYSSMVYSETTKKCEDCPAGQKANAVGDKCEKPKTDQEKKEQGKCPDGKKLDPAVKGQDELTENPKCVDKDNKNCPSGQTMSTARKDKPSACAPDAEPDKKCDKKDTEMFKEVGPDGKMKSTCRSTKAKEDNKKKELKDKQDVISKKYSNAENKDRDRQKKIRARRGACVALGAMSFIDVADINKLTDDELEGLQEPDLDGTDPTPATDLEDYMITLNPPKSVTVATVEMETAGFGGIFTSIGKLVASIFKAGKAISKAATMFKGAARSGGGERFAKLRNRDTNGPASKGAVEAAKKSDTVKKIIKSDTFLDCVALGATVVAAGHKVKRDARPVESQRKIVDMKAGGYLVTIDLDAKKEDLHPVPDANASNAILVVADASEDAKDNDNEPRVLWQTWADSYHRQSRIGYESCNTLRGTDQNNAWTLIQVWGGCCNFYNGENCEADTGLFAMTNREDGDIHGKNNDAVSSFWCTFDTNCKGAPGVK